MACDVDPRLIVLADSPEKWDEFVQSQRDIEQSGLTLADRQMLADLGVAWDNPWDAPPSLLPSVGVATKIVGQLVS